MIYNVRDDFCDMFRPPNIKKIIGDEAPFSKEDRKLANKRRRNVKSIPEDEPDTADNDWDKKHLNDESIVDQHPLREVLTCQKTWKNIAPPIKDVFDKLIEYIIHKDCERHRWKRRLKRRNSMNQRASVLVHKYCMFLMKELENGTEFLDCKIDRRMASMKEQLLEGL